MNKEREKERKKKPNTPPCFFFIALWTERGVCRSLKKGSLGRRWLRGEAIHISI